jgi:hypothetical protein
VHCTGPSCCNAGRRQAGAAAARQQLHPASAQATQPPAHPTHRPTPTLSLSSFSWKWLMVVAWAAPAMYCSLLRPALGGTAGSCSTRPKWPPNVKQRAMPTAPIASSLRRAASGGRWGGAAASWPAASRSTTAPHRPAAPQAGPAAAAMPTAAHLSASCTTAASGDSCGLGPAPSSSLKPTVEMMASTWSIRPCGRPRACSSACEGAAAGAQRAGWRPASPAGAGAHPAQQGGRPPLQRQARAVPQPQPQPEPERPQPLGAPGARRGGPPRRCSPPGPPCRRTSSP